MGSLSIEDSDAVVFLAFLDNLALLEILEILVTLGNLEGVVMMRQGCLQFDIFGKLQSATELRSAGTFLEVLKTCCRT